MAAPRPSRPRRPPFLPPSPSPSRRPRRPPRCRTAYPASGADGLPGCRCRRPAGRCGTALRYAATAGNDRLGSAGLGAGRGLEQAWLRHRTAMGGACGRRSARAHCRRAEGRGAAEVRGGCGGGRWAGGEAGRGAARRGQPAFGVRRWLCGNSRLCRRRCWRSPILRPSGRAWLRPCADGALCRCRLRRSSCAGEEGNAEAALALTRGRRVLRNAFFVSGSFGDRAARVRL